MQYLDGHGLMTSIDRISKRQFTFLINGSAIHTFKRRHSCNMRLEKLYYQTKSKQNE